MLYSPYIVIVYSFLLVVNVIWKGEAFNSWTTSISSPKGRAPTSRLDALLTPPSTLRRNSLFSKCRQVFTFSQIPKEESVGDNDNNYNSDDVTGEESPEAVAKELLQRAEQLRAEAHAMELALQESWGQREKRKSSDIQHLMNKVFGSDKPLTAEAVAVTLREERISEDQLVLLLEALLKQLEALGKQQQQQAVVEKQQLPSDNSKTLTQDALLTSKTAAMSSSNNQTQTELLGTHMQILLDAAAILDNNDEYKKNNRRWSGRVASQLKSRLNEWNRARKEEYKRQLTANVTAILRRNTNLTVSEFTRKILGLETTTAIASSQEQQPLPPVNATRSVPKQVVPMWVPSSLLSNVLPSSSSAADSCNSSSSSVLEASDVNTMKERILSKTRFFCTSSDSIRNAAVFRGNMRPGASAPVGAAQERNFPATVLKEVQTAMDLEEDGLSDRVQVFLLPDPEWRPGNRNGDSRPKPVILALPKNVVPVQDNSGVNRRPNSAIRTILKQSAAVLALSAAFAYAVSCYALNPKFFDAVINRQDLTVLKWCLPIFFGVLAIQTVHEVAHQVVARKRNIQIGLPLLLPSAYVGTFGCITPLRSFPPNRTALLDFALSGPMAASLVSVLFMIVGCYKTIYASEAALLRFPMVPVAWLKRSFLTGSILSFLLPKAMLLPLSQPIPIHPFIMAGFSGLLTNALNLLPIFRLDGGRACAATMGGRVSAIFSAWTLLTMFSLALSGSGLAWTFGTFVLLFQRKTEIPTRDEVTAVDDVRVGAWIASVVLSALVLLPFPGGPGYL